MFALLCFVLAALASPFKSKSRLEAENVALRHQLIVLRRQVRGRVRLTDHDRWFFVQLYRWFPSILEVVSFPKIISGRIGGGVQPGSEWRKLRRSVGPLDAGAVCTENLSADVVVMKSAKDCV
jgi:hypothetical protein